MGRVLRFGDGHSGVLRALARNGGECHSSRIYADDGCARLGSGSEMGRFWFCFDRCSVLVMYKCLVCAWEWEFVVGVSFDTC